MKVKFCGIRRIEDVMLVNEFMPDYTGFVFAESKRQINLDTAIMLSNMIDRKVKTVGVFVDESIENIVRISYIAGLKVIQLHGNEDEAYIKTLKSFLPRTEIWKAVRVSSTEDIKKAITLPIDMLLLDSFTLELMGGTGKVANLLYIKEAKLERKFFLAGGLNSENINSIIEEIQPYGVDISSGIEINGFKNKDKIKEIMRCLK